MLRKPFFVVLAGSLLLGRVGSHRPAQAQDGVVKWCENCGRQVSPWSQPGQRCPWCGAIWGGVRWSSTTVPTAGQWNSPSAWTGYGDIQNPVSTASVSRPGIDRLDFRLREDERKAREQRSRLVRQRGELVKFLNGCSTPLSAAAFRRAQMSLEQTPEMVRLLQSPVPPLDVSEFGFCSTRLWGLVCRDGRLAPPPGPLADPKLDEKLTDARSHFEDCWADLATDLMDGGLPLPSQIAALASSLARWRAAFEAAAKDWSPYAVARCRTHLKALERRVSGLKDQHTLDELRDYLQASQDGFPGGTVAELLKFVEGNRLQLRYGSRPQLVLSELGRDLLQQLDRQIAALDGTVEHYKAQTFALSQSTTSGNVTSLPSLGPVANGQPSARPAASADRLGFLGPLQNTPSDLPSSPGR